MGSARASRAGDGALAIANFSGRDFGVAPKSAREGACAPQSLPLLLYVIGLAGLFAIG